MQYPCREIDVSSLADENAEPDPGKIQPFFRLGAQLSFKLRDKRNFFRAESPLAFQNSSCPQSGL
jgi:hypothetical protein